MKKNSTLLIIILILNFSLICYAAFIAWKLIRNNADHK